MITEPAGAPKTSSVVSEVAMAQCLLGVCDKGTLRESLLAAQQWLYWSKLSAETGVAGLERLEETPFPS
jgi:hypothetical protein